MAEQSYSKSHSERVTPPPHPVQTPDTVVSARLTSGLPYASGHLESNRTAVLQDLGHVYIFPLESLRPLLPPVSQTVPLEEIKKHCVNSGSGRWNAWDRDPVDLKGNENSVFKALPRLFECIVAKINAEPTSKLINNPSGTPKSERSNTSQPDGYLLRNPAMFAEGKRELDKNVTGDFWEDIAVPFEYKKHSKDTDRADNERKIIWSMHHMLRNDPCRRFTFGITIENTDTRVWLFNRAATYVSEAFNFMKDQDTMIHLVASLTLAEDYRLGWDPTLRRKRVGRSMVYEIDVPTGDNGEYETFRANKIISDFGADAMQGRGTRVFRATREDGSTVVVKTMWRDHDRSKEGAVLQDILAKMQTHPEIDYEADKKLFLSVICHGDVQIQGQVDHTLNLIMRGEIVPSDCDTLQIPLPGQISERKRRRSHRGSVGNVPHIDDADTNMHMGGKRAIGAEVGHRIQYRIVFVELGVPLHNLFNLKHMFQALTDAARALKIMFQCGYVHRDVSSGNILYFDGRGILADLEYAKRPSDDAHHDVRTGTLYFIAVEVLTQSYLFRRVKGKPVFKHNPLHDLESLWWVALWALLTRCMKDSPDHAAQHTMCSTIFSTVDFNAAKRSQILSNPYIFELNIQETLPQHFQAAAAYIGPALIEIADRYKHAENLEGPNIDASAFDGAHDAIHALFVKATKVCPGAVISLDSVVSESEERSAKRREVG